MILEEHGRTSVPIMVGDHVVHERWHIEGAIETAVLDGETALRIRPDTYTKPARIGEPKTYVDPEPT